MFISLLHIANYIRSNNIKKRKVNNISELKNFGKAAWSFISSIYESKQDSLSADKNNKFFREKVLYKFTSKVSRNISSPNINTNKSKDKSVIIIRLSPPILAVKIVDGGLYFIFPFHFILFFFGFFFVYFSIFRTARVRGYQSHCHISHDLMAQSQD